MSDPVEFPSKVTPLTAGDPVEAPALSAMGGTFAERKAASEKSASKSVSADEVENKSVSRRRTSKK